MSRYRQRCALLSKVFDTGEGLQLSAKIARLCVLYEDLRIEISGIAEHSLPALDVIDSEHDNRFTPERVGSYRRYYFVRRSISTIREFAEALRLIKDEPYFQHLTLPQEITSMWDAAILFFEKNEFLLRVIRNDVGGHFGQPAALNAIQRFRPDAVSSIELVDDSEIRLHFAGEIAACALLPHLQNEEMKGYEALLKDCIKPAYEYAARCVQILALDYLWSRFGH